MLESAEFNRLHKDLHQLWFWCNGQAQSAPPNLQSRVEAICREVEHARLYDRNAAKLSWLDELLDKGASKGHRWANAPNVDYELGKDS